MIKKVLEVTDKPVRPSDRADDGVTPSFSDDESTAHPRKFGKTEAQERNTKRKTKLNY